MHLPPFLAAVLLALATLIKASALPGKKASDDYDGNTGCTSWCRSNFGSGSYSRECCVPARDKRGPCFECGPRSGSVGRGVEVEGIEGIAGLEARGLEQRGKKYMMLCRQRCVDVTESGEHCGRCEVTCPSGQYCQRGTCKCRNGGTACGSLVCGVSRACFVDRRRAGRWRC
jgi:hypothetical protein